MIGWIARIVAVVALLGAAAAIATPPGQLPLVLRGVLALIRKDCGLKPVASPGQVSPWKRLLALLLVLLAVAVTLF